MGLRERLAGQRILLTGVTGFVGEALLERLLTDVPSSSLVLLVRGQGALGAEERVRELLTRPAFGRLRDQLTARGADIEDLVGDRVAVVAGGLEQVPDLPGDLDLVIHCAGDVSFDPPIDVAVDTNLIGSLNVYDAVLRTGGRPHVVHVSTAYVAGLRRGPAAEGPLTLSADWRAEVAAAHRLRADVEARSRTPDVLRRLRHEAEVEHRRAGPTTIAADVERRRQDWVTRELVDAGRERARSLGFADVYTLTKALTEVAVEERLAGRLPLSVVRPSIIESALERPYPGWIEGFKMAEPIILAYGRGELPEFPAVPDGVLDVIPVDLVVGAVLAVAAQAPAGEETAYFHVSSGARNPLGFHRLYELVREYFQAHPLEDPGRGAIAVPTWAFPGGDRVRGMLRLGERATDMVDRAVGVLPSSARVRETAQKVDRRRRQLRSLRRYMELYGSYTESELSFDDDNTLALHRSLDEADRAEFGCDAAVVDWRHYLQDVHCPAVTAPLRALSGSRRRSAPQVRLNGAGARGVTLAVFDLDGTLMSSNVVESYLRLRLPGLARGEQVREVADVLRSLPRYVIADRRDRGAMLRAVYQRYAGAPLSELDRIVDEQLADEIVARLWPAAVRRVRDHRQAGHRTVLLTGAIRPLTRPLAPLFDDIAAADLATAGGVCTGHLSRPPLVGESRASWLQAYAARLGADLGASYAYGDAASDLPLLRVVGHPVAVSPDLALSRAARRGRWPVEEWQSGRPVPLARDPDARAVDLTAVTDRVTT